jgi:hypothetical protein
MRKSGLGVCTVVASNPHGYAAVSRDLETTKPHRAYSTAPMNSHMVAGAALPNLGGPPHQSASCSE